jgi:hypothetical protein
MRTDRRCEVNWFSMGSRRVTAGGDHKNERSGEYSQDISSVDGLFSF